MVMVNVTEPEVMSAADGVYVAVIDVTSKNVPVPEVVHVDDVALPPRVPASVCVLPEQIVASLPAVVMATDCITSNIASLTGPHGPAGSFVVSVKVTFPAVISAVEGV